MSPTPLAKALRLGRLAYLCWHLPLANMRSNLRNGGPLVGLQTRRGMRAMENSVSNLPVPTKPTNDLPSLRPHLLTGTRYWYQSAYCLFTLAAHSGREVAPVIHDDGTLSSSQIAELRRLFPNLEHKGTEAMLERLEQHLPDARFPVLRERWSSYPHIRKLINVHLGEQGWKLVLDSDLLFFRRPGLLIDWCDSPALPIQGIDCGENYGYSRPLLEQVCGTRLPERVNVGLCGLDSSSIDWVQLETWTAALMRAEGSNYLLEQALVAMLVAKVPRLAAAEHDYRTLPTPTEALKPTAIMHHYVDNTKRHYFGPCWRQARAAALRALAGTPAST